MAINFPTSPFVGQVYSFGTDNWAWNGNSWDSLITTVANIAALRAISPSTAFNINVEGYYNNGDGGGGIFYGAITGGPYTDNGGTIITSGLGVTAASAWLRTDAPINSVKWYGAVGDGVADDTAEIQVAANDAASSIALGDGSFLLSSNVTMTVPKTFSGNGKLTVIETAPGFGATPILTISPTVGSDPKNWEVSDFGLTNNGSATSAIKIDLDASGKYTSKLSVKRIVSNTAVSTGRFVELTNAIPNMDGLFTSVFEDNWSFGGYYLDNVGDSVSLIRNTTTGAGIGYYINQLGTAAAIIIRDGNCTSSGGALNAVAGSDIIFEGMQCECPNAFTGTDNAMVSLNHSAAGLIFNSKIINCSINTQGNPFYCVYLNYTDQTIIDGCNLYCDPGSGAHIYIDTGARNTIIGNNKYFSSVTGAEIAPIIVNNGIGTVNVWNDATITLAGWSSSNTPTENNLSYLKDRSGNVFIRGRVSGPAATVGDVLFTLPVGYRPKTKVYVIYSFGAVSAVAGTVVYQILATGAVQIITASTTSIYFSTTSFSTL